MAAATRRATCLTNGCGGFAFRREGVLTVVVSGCVVMMFYLVCEALNGGFFGLHLRVVEST